VGNNEFGLLVRLGIFTTQAKTFAKSKVNLRLIDGDGLLQLVFQHYDQLDSRYKGLLPLRRVYVPEAIERDEESQEALTGCASQIAAPDGNSAVFLYRR
jgi:restriction system protein